MFLFENELQNRRELLRTFGRTIALGGLVYVGGMALSRKLLPQPEDACGKLDPCKICNIFDQCTLPQALTTKRRSQEPNHG